MPGFIRGFAAQWLALVMVGRYRVLLLLFVGASWVSMEIYRGAVVSDLPIVFVDHDGSRVSRTLRSALESTRDVRVLPAAPPTLREASALLRAGRAAAVVLVPAELSRDIKRGRSGHVVVAVDMSNILTGKIAAKAVSRVLATVNIGLQVTTLGRMGERARVAVAAMAPLVVDESFTFNPTTSYAAYMAPALTFFFLHLMVLILACSLALPLAPARSVADAAGRAVALVALTMAGAVLLAYGFLPREGLVMRSGLGVLLVVAGAAGASIVAMSAAAVLVAPRPLIGLQATLLAGMLSLMLSGATWPSDALPPLLRSIAEALPFTALTRGYRMFLPQQVTAADLRPVLRLLFMQIAGWGAVAAGAYALRRARGSVHARTRSGSC